MDEKLINYLYSQFEHANGISLPKDELTGKRIQDACKRALADLETQDETEINLPFIMADSNGPKHLNVTINKEILSKLSVGGEQTYQKYSSATHSSTSIDDIISSSTNVDDGAGGKSSMILWGAIALVVLIAAVAFFILKKTS